MPDIGSQKSKTRDFRDLRVWQTGHEIVLLTYELVKSFPKEELFGLTSQMKRASLSVTSNIAEGFGRHQAKDKEHFYVMAYGSLIELENQYEAAKDLKFVSFDDYSNVISLIRFEGRMLNKFLTAHRSK